MYLHFTIRSVEFKTMSALDIFMGSGSLQANVFLPPRTRSALFSACFRGGEMRLVQWHHSDASPPCLTAGCCCCCCLERVDEDDAAAATAAETETVVRGRMELMGWGRWRKERESARAREILSARCTTLTWRSGELPRTRVKGLVMLPSGGGEGLSRKRAARSSP